MPSKMFGATSCDTDESEQLIKNLLLNIELMSNKITTLLDDNAALLEKIEQMSKRISILSENKLLDNQESNIWIDIKGIECCSHKDAAEFLGYKSRTLANKKKALGLENEYVIGKKVYYSKRSVIAVKKRITSCRKDLSL